MLCGFDFVIAPLARADYRPPAASGGIAAGGGLVAPFKREDVLYLNSSEFVNQVRLRMQKLPPGWRQACMHAAMQSAPVPCSVGAA